jgi:hypothetical protein
VALLPALAVTAAVVAGAAVAVAPSLQADPSPVVVAEAAVAPVPVTLSPGPSAHEEKALRRDASAAASARAAATRQARAEQTRRASRARRTPPVATDPRGIARALLADRGQAGHYGCLDSLWTKESEWRVHASNRSSGAYGIPQSLPASKMASAGADWRTSAHTQIRWGLGYIDARYGSPCSAWAHSRSHGWY